MCLIWKQLTCLEITDVHLPECWLYTTFITCKMLLIPSREGPSSICSNLISFCRQFHIFSAPFYRIQIKFCVMALPKDCNFNRFSWAVLCVFLTHWFDKIGLAIFLSKKFNLCRNFDICLKYQTFPTFILKYHT